MLKSGFQLDEKFVKFHFCCQSTRGGGTLTVENDEHVVTGSWNREVESAESTDENRQKCVLTYGRLSLRETYILSTRLACESTAAAIVSVT